MKRYLYAKPGSGAQGPYDGADLRRLLVEGVISAATLVTEEGMEAWRPLAQVIDLPGPAAGAPPGQPTNQTPSPVPAPRLALFSNGAAVLLSLAIIASACLVAYRPGSSDPVARFKRSAEEKRARLEQSIASCGSKLRDYKFDIRRTNSEITPYEAEMTFRYDDETDGSLEVQAIFRCREGVWRTESITTYCLSKRTPPPGATAQVPNNRIIEPIGYDADTKIVGNLEKKQ